MPESAPDRDISTPTKTKVKPDMTKYYTPSEVELHNSQYDLWLSWLGHVYDLTVFAEERKGSQTID